MKQSQCGLIVAMQHITFLSIAKTYYHNLFYELYGGVHSIPFQIVATDYHECIARTLSRNVCFIHVVLKGTI